MLKIEHFNSSADDWNKLVCGYPDLSIMQTWEYGEAKRAVGGWNPERFMFLRDGKIIGVVQALTKSIPMIGGGLAWINQGPVWNRSEYPASEVVPDMFGCLRRHYVEKRKLLLRCAPNVHEGEIATALLTKHGFSMREQSEGWHSARIDLSPPLEEIRKRLARKWRGDLNASERRGATCIDGRTDELLTDFLAHYQPFIAERNIETQLTPDFLHKLQNCLPDERKMWLFEARFDGEHLGGLMIATYGYTSLALAGSNPTERGRELRSGNYIWWQAIEKMKQLGFRWLDVGGSSPTFTSNGILHFKEGLKAEPFALVKEFEASNGGLRDRLIQWRIRRAQG